MIRVYFRIIILFFFVAAMLSLTSSPALTQPASKHGRPTSAYVAFKDGIVILDEPSDAANAPRTSLVETGYGSTEASLAITRDGTIFVAPIFTDQGNGVLRSRDNGATWQPLIPKFSNGKGHQRVQPYMYLDPVTERLFFHTCLMKIMPPWPVAGFNLSWSDNQGDTWNNTVVAKDVRDWAKVVSGPSVTSKTKDYPNLLYFTGPSPISVRFFPLWYPNHQSIYKSLDGGQTWDETGQISLKPKDHGCRLFDWIIMGSAVAGKDGTLYIGMYRCHRLGVGISHDEGKTWTVNDIPGSDLLTYFNILQVGLINPNYCLDAPLTLDSEGNIYALWPDKNDVLRLAISKNRGQTWSTPVVVSAPGVTHVRYSAITTKAPGIIAIAYYGTTDGKKYNGYMAESVNALDENPRFWSGTANDPADPLYPNDFSAGYIDMFFGGDMNEIIKIKYAPNGDIWATFAKDMHPGLFSYRWKKSEHAGSGLQSVLGHMEKN
jgi:hypothetical protein